MKLEEQKIEDELKLKYSRNIYDVLVSIYELVDNLKMPQYLHNYYTNLDKYDFQKINLLLDSVVNCDIEFEIFVQELINLMKRLEEDITLCAIHILKYFDGVLKEKEEYPALGFGQQIKTEYCSLVGPLNEKQDKYWLFLLPRQGSMLQESEILKNRRKIDQRSGSDIFAYIESYRIVKKSTKQQLIVLKEYKENLWNKMEDKYRIAIVPVANKEWFGVKYIDCSEEYNLFEIVNSVEKGKEINKSYIRLLEKLIELKVEIVIFPEMGMNEETENEIQNFLIRKSLKNENTIKLIFLGSLWKEGKNQCVLMSGAGTILLRNKKENPFLVEKNGKKYYEKLECKPEKYEIIDIDNLGRILYVVCKDGLEDFEQREFWSDYEINMEVISSYSPSISFFEQHLSDFVKKYNGIGIVANSCAARLKTFEKNKDTGFIILPELREEDLFCETCACYGYKCIEEEWKECNFGKCVHIYDIHPKKEKSENNKISVQITYEKHTLMS